MTVVTRVYGSPKDALADSSLGRLKELHRAIALYKAQYGDGTLTGGLPPRAFVMETYMGYPKDYFISPCANERGFRTRSSDVSYVYTWAPERAALFDTLGFQSPILVDLDCTPITMLGKQSIALAVLLDGTVVQREGPGNAGNVQWWLEGR